MATKDIKIKIDAALNLAPSIQQLKELKKLQKEVGAGTDDYKKLAGAIDNLEDKLKGAKEGAADWVDSLENAGGPVGNLGKAINTAKVSFTSFNTALKASVIGLIVAAVGGLVAAFSESEEATKKLQPLFVGLEKILGGIFRALEPVLDAFVDLAMKALPYVTKGIGIFYSSLVGLFTYIKEAGTGVAKIWKGIFTLDLDSVKEGIGQIKDSFSKAAQAGVEAYARFEEGTKEQTKTEKENAAERKKTADEEAKKKKEIADKALQDNIKRQEAQNKLDEANLEKRKALELSAAQTELERIDIEAKYADLSYEQKKKDLEKKQKLYKKDSADYNAIQAEIIKLEADNITKRAELITKREEIIKKQVAESRKQDLEDLKQNLDNQVSLYGENSEQARAAREKLFIETKKIIDAEIKELENKELIGKKLTDEEINRLRELERQREAISIAREAQIKKDLQSDIDAFIKKKNDVYDAEVAAAGDNVDLIRAANEKRKKEIEQYLDDLVQKELITAEQRKKIQEGLVGTFSKGEKDIIDARDRTIKKYQDQIELLNTQQKSLIKGTKAIYQNRIKIIDESTKLEKANAEKKRDEDLTRAQNEIKDEDKLNEEKGRINQLFKDKQVEIDKQSKQQKKEALYQTITEGVETAKKTADDIFTVINSINEARETKRLSQLEKQKKAEIEAAKGNKEEIAKIEAEYAKKEDDIKRKAFERNKKTQIAYAIVQTLLSAVQAFSSLAAIPVVGPILGGIAAAAALAAGYASVAKIKATQYQSDNVPAGGNAAATAAAPSEAAPKGVVASKAEGGYIQGPGTETSDSIPAMLSNGEFVVRASQTKKFRPMLEAINSGSLLPKFAIGGVVGASNQVKQVSPETSITDILKLMNDRPIRTYVTATEMSNQQQFDRTIKSRSLL